MQNANFVAMVSPEGGGGPLYRFLSDGHLKKAEFHRLSPLPVKYRFGGRRDDYQGVVRSRSRLPREELKEVQGETLYRYDKIRMRDE